MRRETHKGWEIVQEGAYWRLNHVGHSSGLVSMGGGKTREEAEGVLAALVANGTCRECGEVGLNANYAEPYHTRIIDEQLCFNCLFWVERMEERGPEVAVIDGWRYVVGEEKPKGYQGFKGFGGRRFVILFDDGRRVETTNLWSQGDIPPHFLDRFPNNATFERAAAVPATNEGGED